MSGNDGYDGEFYRVCALTGKSSPRAHQKAAVVAAMKAFDNGKRYVVLNAPTGSGKSIIAYAVAKHIGNSYFLTHQKILQAQYHSDFNMPFVFSSQNYPCARMEGCDCKQCYLAETGKKKCDDCGYGQAKKAAFSADACSLNYSYFFSLTGAMRESFAPLNRDFIVCDEAHKLPDELISRGTITLDEAVHSRMIGLYASKVAPVAIPDFNGKPDMDILDYVTGPYFAFAGARLDEIKMLLSQYKTPPSGSRMKEFKRLQAAKTYYTQMHCEIADLKDFALRSPYDVVITRLGGAVIIKPLRANGLFRPLLGRHAKKMLFMSATILDKEAFCKSLGIREEECEYITLDSTFPAGNRPIFYSPVGSMSYGKKSQTLPRLVSAVGDILDAYPGVKGIIHTANYWLARELDTGLSGRACHGRLVFVTAENKDKALADFAGTAQPKVLVSPSLSEGLDLKDDLSRLCVICKVPYASLGDEWVTRKMRIDPRWYAIKTAETMIQQTGRSIRSPSDHADTYILDDDFKMFAARNYRLFPRWWLESIDEKNDLRGFLSGRKNAIIGASTTKDNGEEEDSDGRKGASEAFQGRWCAEICRRERVHRPGRIVPGLPLSYRGRGRYGNVFMLLRGRVGWRAGRLQLQNRRHPARACREISA